MFDFALARASWKLATSQLNPGDSSVGKVCVSVWITSAEQPRYGQIGTVFFSRPGALCALPVGVENISPKMVFPVDNFRRKTFTEPGNPKSGRSYCSVSLCRVIMLGSDLMLQ